MSLLAVPALLAVFLVLAATGGPMLVRTASPVLMRYPRMAVLLLTGSLLMWLLAVASVSLLLAWVVTGPQILPSPVGQVCQRCIAAASPFAPVSPVETMIPVLFVLLLPVLAAVAFIGMEIPQWLNRYRATRRISRDLAGSGRKTHIDGHTVMLIPDSRLLAFSLPRRLGGIVVSDGLCNTLDTDELSAVLMHERAHLRQRHHAILAIVKALTRPLCWVPLASALAEAIPQYLEIAADNAARRHTGTCALAGALLKIAGPNSTDTLPTGTASGSLLHAAGPDRIGHLVAPARKRTALLPMSTLGIQLAAFAIVVSIVYGPYLYVAATGCQLPT